MRYKTVKIDVGLDGKWRSTVSDIPGDRAEVVDPKPNSLGFFYYPETISDRDALTMLISHLTSDRLNSIDELCSAVRGLSSLIPYD